MPRDVMTLVKEMARREATAALLPAPRVEWGAEGPSVGIRLTDCPVCGTHAAERDWAPPFAGASARGPVLRMLACETVTARALLPIVAASERSSGEFRTRAVTWLDVAHLGVGAALEAVEAAERWVTAPGTPGRTLPASTRHHDPGSAWPRHREGLVPSFLSPHPAVPAPLERLYAQELRAAVVRGYERVCPAR
jgi:hypothetical protein